METDNKDEMQPAEGENILPGVVRMNKEDMLNLEKGAQAMDNIKLPADRIGGRTISGAGSGPGTGDPSGDFDRPGTEGTPAINDYVSREGLDDTPDKDPLTIDTADDVNEDLPEGRVAEGEESSGYPGGGAARNAEDRISPASSANEATDS
jgi:hypothetical protein